MSSLIETGESLHWTGTSEHFCALYSTELVLGVFALAVNVFIMLYAFSGDRFNPHTAMVRLLLFVDVLASIGHVLEALGGVLEKSAEITEAVGPPDVQFISVSNCIVYRPYLFLFLMARQWGGLVALIMGLERFLFICYPLWFKVVRVRRLPIVVFSICFIFLSASIGYTNALVVTPNEGIHFTCESTWAFGDNFGWCQTAFIFGTWAVGWSFTYYSHTVAAEERALMRFGNNRTRMASERRKIRKAMYILSITLVFACVPQIAVVVLRLMSRWRLQQWKLGVQLSFLLKVFVNIQFVRKLGRGSSIWVVMSRIFCCCCKPVRRPRNVVADNVESVASISKYVH
ncbi:hypothetical protein M3Y99_01696400 [Aphelenchoides fujianensis]|nr:hypothetical protein M3Y99_01696400 [Aphelenchoides fujianensis]